MPAQIAQEGEKARREIRETGDQVLARISQGAEKAIREAAVSDVGTKIETAMAGPLKTIDRSLKKLEQSASTAELAADRWRMFTRMFRWQQLAIAVLCGILIGAVGHWYFATRGPETEAVQYLLFVKHGMEQKLARRARPLIVGRLPRTLRGFGVRQRLRSGRTPNQKRQLQFLTPPSPLSSRTARAQLTWGGVS